MEWCEREMWKLQVCTLTYTQELSYFIFPHNRFFSVFKFCVSTCCSCISDSCIYLLIFTAPPDSPLNTDCSTGQIQTSDDEKENLPDRPTCCPSTVAYRWVILREYPPNGRWGSSVRVMGTEMLMGPESSSRRGTWVLERAWPLVTTMLSGVVDSFRPCFIVSFSDTQKSSSL